ncbi:cation efflux family protein [Mycobacterium ulcerans str. Harvey]|uniref:Cation efflux family protein n=1 Tax=Mycobacterium ulcerans str. Harvey TaxID=1299332 RepID=A0ABN0R375_MYCUL|nr:cation efflux family protein [Mycobacterium ulcerans str. Harvey]
MTGLIELAIALVSGSVALLGDALHNLYDVSTSLVVFVGFRSSRKSASERYPYGLERAEDLAGIGVALVIWASAAVAGTESVGKLLRHGSTQHVGWGSPPRRLALSAISWWPVTSSLSGAGFNHQR